MPSLRRTSSCTAVRSSPYSYPAFPSTMTRQGGNTPRRSSGSDIVERRILADLDWWRVEEGQRELRDVPPPAQLPSPADTEEEQEQFPEDISVAPSPPPTRDLNVNTESLSSPLPGAGSSALESPDFSHVHYFLGMDYQSFGSSHEPQPNFPLLSLPDREPGRRRLTVSSDTSSSSLESSPASSPRALSPLEDMGFADMVPPVSDDTLFSALSHSSRRAPSLAFGVRSVSYSFVESELSRGCDDLFENLPSFPTSQPDYEDLFY